MSGRSTVHVRRATDADRDAILAVCAAALGWKPQDPNAAFFSWKHDDNAFGASPMWVAADEADRIVGVRAFMRWRFATPNGGRIEMVRAVDTATHPDAMGQGIFRRLTLGALPALADMGVDAVFNTPNDKSRPGYLKMGWQIVGRVPVQARVTNPGAVLRMARSRTGAQKMSAECDAGRPAGEVFSDGDATAALLERQPAVEGITTDRSAAYLLWRYRLDHLRYRVVLAGDRLEDGAVVFRLRRRGDATEAAICEVLEGRAGQRGLRAALRDVAAGSDADYLLSVRSANGRVSGFVPVPKAGPVLTWKPLSTSRVPAIRGLRLQLGDVELF